MVGEFLDREVVATVGGEVGDESSDVADAAGGVDVAGEGFDCLVAEVDGSVEVGVGLAYVGGGEEGLA